MMHSMSGARRGHWAWLIVLASLLAPPARANPPEGQHDAQHDARTHYEAGLSHYHLGEFDAAISEFKTAYSISNAPRLLFDIAQAQRLKKDYAQALYSYTTYLRLVPAAPNRADVTARIAELNQILAEKATPPSASLPPSPSPEPSPPVAEPSPEPTIVPPPSAVPPPVASGAPRSARVELWTGVALVLGGAVLAAGAAGCTAQAASDGKSLTALKSGGGAWNGHYQSVYEQGVRSQNAAAALWALSGATAAVGAVLAVVGARASRRVQVGASAGRGGAGLTLGGRLP
jgi:tetratricopeptide (TPR) repeat protein